MATERAAHPWTVEVWVPDETETTVVPGNFDHNQAVGGTQHVLEDYAYRQHLVWLVRDDTELDYPRVDGSTGSLFPDVIMARDVRVPPTEPYNIVAVGKPPDLIVEVLSPSTAGEDRGDKMLAYAQMGVGEYVIFDPRQRRRPLLAGYRLVAWGRYEPIPGAWGGGVWLRSVGLRAVADPAIDEPERGPRIRFYTEAGDPLPHIEEERDAIQRAEQARLQAEQERRAAEAEIARLRALLASRGRGRDPEMDV